MIFEVGVHLKVVCSVTVRVFSAENGCVCLLVTASVLLVRLFLKMDKEVIKISFFTELRRHEEITKLFPCLDNTNTVLSIGVILRLRSYLDWAYLEGTNYFLNTQVAVSHTFVSLLLLLDGAQGSHVVVDRADYSCFVSNAELSLANLIEHLEVLAETISFTYRLGHKGHLVVGV